MKEYENYVNEDMLSNIFSNFGNVFGIVSNPNVINDYGKCFGKVIMKVSIKSKKKIDLKDIIEFDKTKIKWRSSQADSDGCMLCLVNPYWCRMYKLDEKIEVPVIIQKSEAYEDTRRYWEDKVYQVMNRNQFFKRRLIDKQGEYTYAQTEAVSNFEKRLGETKNYYKSLNETARNYRINHKVLESLRGIFSNFRKEIYKEWDQLLLKHYRNNTSNVDLKNLLDRFKKETSNIVRIYSS